jgi:hypothetical protein
MVGNMTHKKLKIRKQKLHVICEVLMALTMKITVFWDVTPCILVHHYQHSGRKIQAADSSEMLVMIY